MSESYGVLGRLFEYLNADCDYSTWSQYLLNKLKNAGCGNTGLDIGCGNGYFTRALNRAGYAVDGMDISASALTVAKQLAAREGVRCEFLMGDICKLKVCKKLDFAIAVNDCINYVSKQKLSAAFRHVYGALKANGAFFFDISTPKKIRQVLGDNLFAEDREELSYIWFNKQTDDGVKMDLTFFIKKDGGLFERFDETHYQYAHSRDEIISALKEAGFARIEVEEHPLSPSGERLQFSAYKR